MAVRYFKKPYPETKVILSNNTTVEFGTVDGLAGFFATESKWVADEFERKMALQQDAITEITPAEFFAQYVEAKKNSPLRRSNQPWREEIGPGGLKPGRIAQLGAENVQQAVAVNKTDVPRPPQQAAAVEIAPTEPKAPAYVPTTGRRGKPKR